MSGGVDGNPLILATALLLAGGVLLSKTSAKLGVPGLLLFLGLGMVAGSEGVFDIEFDNFDIAAEFGTIALAFILFSGGLDSTVLAALVAQEWGCLLKNNKKRVEKTI